MIAAIADKEREVKNGDLRELSERDLRQRDRDHADGVKKAIKKILRGFSETFKEAHQ